MADFMHAVNCAGPLILSFLRLPCGSDIPVWVTSGDHLAYFGLPAYLYQLAVILDATMPLIQPPRHLYELAHEMDHTLVCPDRAHTIRVTPQYFDSLRNRASEVQLLAQCPPHPAAIG